MRYIDTTKTMVWCISLLLLSIDIRWLCYFILFYFKQTNCAMVKWCNGEKKIRVGSFVSHTVIIVTYFVWYHHRVFIIATVTRKCAILILRKLWFGVCHCCYCILIYDDYVILLCFILNWPILKWCNGGWWNGVMVK